ncbi:hypothetical protein [Luteolibacter sp. LG18]
MSLLNSGTISVPVGGWDEAEAEAEATASAVMRGSTRTRSSRS